MSQELTEIERTVGRQVEILTGALVGLGVIALVQMLSLQSLDVPLIVSVYSFAVSIPSLSAVFLCMMEEAKFGVTTHERISTVMAILLAAGNLGTLIGISALFFHFATYAGIIFIASSLIGLVCWISYSNALGNHRGGYLADAKGESAEADT